MFTFLSKPYPFDTSLRRRIIVSFLVSFFVFLFLTLFQPFGLNSYTAGPIVFLTLGYGLVSFGVMFLINLLIIYGFPNYFNEESWTTAKEILWFTIMIGLIGIANTLYTVQMNLGQFELSWKAILIYEGYTLAVGVFPIAISIIVNQARLNAAFVRNSSEINLALEQEQLLPPEREKAPLQDTPKNTSVTFRIVAENGKDYFETDLAQVLFIKSADNYVEVFYLENRHTRCELIRTTLKKCEELLKEYPSFFRCHKSYLVDLTKVKHVSGNAQGYKLHLADTDEVVPVSRAHNELIRKRLASRP